MGETPGSWLRQSYNVFRAADDAARFFVFYIVTYTRC